MGAPVAARDPAHKRHSFGTNASCSVPGAGARLTGEFKQLPQRQSSERTRHADRRDRRSAARARADERSARRGLELECGEQAPRARVAAPCASRRLRGRARGPRVRRALAGGGVRRRRRCRAGGLAAAELWGLRRAKGSITVVAPRQVRVAGVLVRRCNRLDPRDVTVRNGIPVTTVARTIVDLAEILTVEQLANVMYEAAYLGLLDIEAVEADRRPADRPAWARDPRGGDRRAPQGECGDQEREGGHVPRPHQGPAAQTDRQRQGARARGRRVLARPQVHRRGRWAWSPTASRPPSGCTARQAASRRRLLGHPLHRRGGRRAA